jgi:hypothetical protein
MSIISIVICPKCQQLNYVCGENFNCFNCAFWEKANIILEEDIEHKENRKAKNEVKEKDLKFWIGKQEELSENIIRECLPRENIKVKFSSRGLKNCWGITEYYENDVSKAEKAKKRYLNKLSEGKSHEAYWLRTYGLTQYSSKPSKITIHPKTLKTKYSTNTLYGVRGAGFLPTSTHEAAHASYKVVHHPSFSPWVDQGHDRIWKKTAAKFHDQMKIKYGSEINNRFKELEKIKGESKDYEKE